MLKHGILGLLSYGSMSGYDISRTFKDSLNYFWTAQTSQIYRELQTLKEKGWANNEIVEQKGKPDKKVFSITESGRQELNRWLTDDNTEFAVRSPLLMKIFFRGERSIDENIQYFDKMQEKGKTFISMMQRPPESLINYSEKIDDPLKAVYWKMTLEYGIMYQQMYLNWVEKCKKELEEIKNEYFDNKWKSEGNE